MESNMAYYQKEIAWWMQIAEANSDYLEWKGIYGKDNQSPSVGWLNHIRNDQESG